MDESCEPAQRTLAQRLVACQHLWTHDACCCAGRWLRTALLKKLACVSVIESLKLRFPASSKTSKAASKKSRRFSAGRQEL